jgi:hypothetical protein
MPNSLTSFKRSGNQQPVNMRSQCYLRTKSALDCNESTVEFIYIVIPVYTLRLGFPFPSRRYIPAQRGKQACRVPQKKTTVTVRELELF